MVVAILLLCNLHFKFNHEQSYSNTSNEVQTTTARAQCQQQYIIPQPSDRSHTHLIERLQHQHLLPKCTKSEQNFVYIKTHKCASDTLSNIFRRFGILRNLSFVHPIGDDYTLKWPRLLEPYMYRASKSGEYNILTDHTIYNESYMDALMVPSTKYITSVREPFSRLGSAFIYSHVSDKVKTNASVGSDKLLAFLRDKDYWNEAFKRMSIYKGMFSPMKNTMSLDLGLPTGVPPGRPNYEDDLLHIQAWLHHLSDKFQMVM